MPKKTKLPMAALGGMGPQAPSALGDPSAGLMAPPASPMANFAPSDLVKKPAKSKPKPKSKK